MLPLAEHFEHATMSHLSLVKKLSFLQEERKHVEYISLAETGISFERGSLIEISGGAATGKTSIIQALLADLTIRGEVCAVVDSCNGFDPISASLTGIVLENLLWVRCGGDIERAFLAADHLVRARGFGAIWLNLAGLQFRKLSMVPKTYWYRYRTRISETPTLFVVTAEEPVTGSASQQSFCFQRKNKAGWSGSGRFKLLRSLDISINSKKQFYGRPHFLKIIADQTNA